jgi:hypothetical protein
MALTRRGRRSCLAVLATVATGVASLTLVPALAQVSDEPAPEPYVELMTSILPANQYVRFVDGVAATDDPQQGFASLTPWVLRGDPALITVAATAHAPTVLSGTGCLGAGGAPIGPLPPTTAAHYVQAPVAWLGALPLIGVTSYTCAGGATPTIVAEDAKASIKPGETLAIGRGADLPLDFRRVKLSIHASSASEVRLRAVRDGAVVGAIDVDIDVDCVNSTDWMDEDALCATRVEPYFGPLQQRYLNLDFGASFDSLEVTSTAGAVRLKGNHPSRFFLDGEAFGGTIGGDTGEDAIAEPPTDTLPGYEVSCSDAADPPPEGPCGGKEVSLAIARSLADVDGDGTVDQVLSVVPTGDVGDPTLLTIIVSWAPEPAPVGAVPLSAFDEDDDGPDDDDPASWCSVDPPGAPGDAWCLVQLTSDSVGDDQIQVTDTYQGTGDPRFTR